VCTSPAQALLARVFVSGKGANAPGCGAEASPCRTFQYAQNILAPGGVIAVLDSGDYFPVTINKSLSIVNDGAGTALVRAASGQAAITINAAAGDKVLLRGLTVEGGGRGTYGLRFVSGFRLSVSNCVFRGFTADGIYIQSDTPMGFSISHTISDDNGGAGFSINNAAGAWGTIDGVETSGNNYGIFVIALSNSKAIATVSNSTASNNRADGIAVRGPNAHLLVTDTVSSNNTNTGFNSIDFGRMTLIRSAATANGAGISATGPAYISDTKVSYSTNCGFRNTFPAHMVLTRSAGIDNSPDVCGTGNVYTHGDNTFGTSTVTLLPLNKQ
ncbi:MAG TPA: right-handed parallel beta-helix repeat-containing protein, partial [Methylocella sp.]|nr:right-handed parallel beta-helix repeat-containing protein [Methylocella sp.]